MKEAFVLNRPGIHNPHGVGKVLGREAVFLMDTKRAINTQGGS